MVTLEQIKQAHGKVKSGADFPAYIKEIKQLGVKYYDSFVADGHTEFLTETDNKFSSPAKYESLIIAENSNGEQFKQDLKDHQQGKTDYLTFCKICAALGVEKWAVDTEKMTCSYYSKKGDVILVEIIPS